MQSGHEFRRCLVDHKSLTYPSEGDSLLHFFLAHKVPQALGCHLCRACGLWGKSSKMGPKKNLYHERWARVSPNFGSTNISHLEAMGLVTYLHRHRPCAVKYHHALSLAHPHQTMVPLWANKRS
ncbi:hypothetical protein HBI42_105370 [Parastagonospora nodorum]|nr:hypothetical protein HBI43_103930 [Parastagonospora nodorum]KAH6257963.1 hypothetical protein HBI42_105370 [Parastagonospora nodorum]